MKSPDFKDITNPINFRGLKSRGFLSSKFTSASQLNAAEDCNLTSPSPPALKGRSSGEAVIETEYVKTPTKPFTGIGRLRWGLAAVALALTIALTTCVPKATPLDIAQIRSPNLTTYNAPPREMARPMLSPTPTTISAKPFLTGVNMPAVLNWPESDVDLGLKEIQRMKGSLVRLFVANNQLSDLESAEKLNIFLDKTQQYGISVIPVFIDYHGGPWDRQSTSKAYINAACPEDKITPNLTKDFVILCKDRIRTWPALEQEILAAGYGNGFNPQGTDEFYIQQGQYGVLNKNFFSEGYKGRYLEFVRNIIKLTKYHSNIYAWEVGNELRAEPQTFISFMRNVIATIRSEDPLRKISTGMADSKLTNLSPEELYSKIDVDVVTVHAYEGSRMGVADIKWALEHGKVPLVEEIGFWGDGDRSRKMEIEASFWKDAVGTKGILPWGFVPAGAKVKQPGDNGFSYLYPDYDKISALLKSLSN